MLHVKQGLLESNYVADNQLPKGRTDIARFVSKRFHSSLFSVPNVKMIDTSFAYSEILPWVSDNKRLKYIDYFMVGECARFSFIHEL